MIRLPFIPVAVGLLDDLLVICILALVIWLVLRVVQGGRAQTPEPPRDEDEALNRLCSQLERMERRMENLETILMDKEARPDEHKEQRTER